jgi:hypothetical protein
MAMVAPDSANIMAVALPIPLEAPVTRTFLFLNDKIMTFKQFYIYDTLSFNRKVRHVWRKVSQCPED